VATAPDRAGRLSTAGALVCRAIVLVGFAIVASGLAELRSAHLYRQSSGEGIGFVWPAILLVSGGGLVAGGSAGTLLLGVASTGRRRQLLFGLAALALCALAIAAAVAVWVVGRGDRCIGPCG